MADGSEHFRKYLVEGIEPDVERIKSYVERSLMLVTALSPVIGDDKASQTAHHALDQTSRSGRRKMVAPYVAADGTGTGGTHNTLPRNRIISGGRANMMLPYR